MVHLVAAMIGLVFIAWTYVVAWMRISENQLVINQIVDEVARIRKERGLDD